jgi:Asp-tRNA(Asn)/Glu-tRNA(Gln) amidotransferase A subunit family amidase
MRAPSSVNGIVGLKPTTGLASRNGIIPLGLSLDTGGPMARSVSDIAGELSIVAGVDPVSDLIRKCAAALCAGLPRSRRTDPEYEPVELQIEHEKRPWNREPIRVEPKAAVHANDSGYDFS